MGISLKRLAMGDLGYIFESSGSTFMIHILGGAARRGATAAAAAVGPVLLNCLLPI